MGKPTLRWGQDSGFQDKIRSFTPKTRFAEHGIRGGQRNGDLGFSRLLTKREAKRDAADGVPPSEAKKETEWSEREQIITEKAENLRRGLGSWFRGMAGDVKNYIRDCTPAALDSEQIKEAVKSDEAELRHYEKDDSELARVEHAMAKAELDEFQDAHAQRIGKRTPDIKTNVEQTIAVLLAIMILEGGFNALLFKDAQSSGLLGGVLVAFGVSAVNVCFGVLGGFLGLRYLNHSKLPFRLLGGLVATSFIGLGIFLNFFVAHFRDVVEIGLHASAAAGASTTFSMFSVPPGDVIASMFPNVFGLSSLVAIGLLLIGLAVFAMALYEGYEKISDRYPGYGRVWRKERQAYERRQTIRTELRDDLSAYFSDCRDWFDTQHSRHLMAKREIEKAMTQLETAREQALGIADRAADQERGLKMAYRQSHRRMRNALRDTLGEAANIPVYFDEIITPKTPEFDYGSERSHASDALLSIETNIREISETRKWLEQHIQTTQERLDSIQNVTGGDDIHEQKARASKAAQDIEKVKSKKKAA